MLGFVWDFEKHNLFVIWWDWFLIYDLGFYNEIDNELFNKFILYFVNFIIELKILVNV